MPIEIKELFIKVAVSSPVTADKPADSKASADSSCAEVTDREQMVADCVEQVLQILKEKCER